MQQHNNFKKDIDLLSEAYGSIHDNTKLSGTGGELAPQEQTGMTEVPEDLDRNEDNEIGPVDVTDVMNKIEQMDAGQMEELLQGLAYHFDASGDVPDEVRHAFEQVSDHLHEALAAWQNRISN